MEMTEKITARIAEDESFAKHVSDSLERFRRHDWGRKEEYPAPIVTNTGTVVLAVTDSWEERHQKNLEQAKTRIWPRSNFGDQFRIIASYGWGDDSLREFDGTDSNRIIIIEESPFVKAHKRVVGSLVVLYPHEM